MRRLIICADGTWNRPGEERDGVEVSTNVVKMARAIRPVTRDGISQIVSYHEGVGTNGRMDRMLGGAFGLGIDRTIIDCYRFLINNYVEGDELCFFGFSRGAYTVRSLAGLLRNSGLLRIEHGGLADEAYTLYRDRDDGKHPNAAESVKFRESYAHPEMTIRCIGVWDTVGALGVPVGVLHRITNRRHGFHDVTLSSKVQNAFHALSIDERRKPFKPTLWEQPVGDRNWLEQAWFAGVHSNVGGGYADAGLSDITFRWMTSRVSKRCGVEFDQAFIDRVAPSPTGRIYDSMSEFFRPLGEFTRNIDEKAILAEARGVRTCEYVHESVQARIAATSATEQPYNPNNVLQYLGRERPKAMVLPEWPIDDTLPSAPSMHS